MLKTNLGPKGTMKMLVSGAGDIKITKVKGVGGSLELEEGLVGGIGGFSSRLVEGLVQDWRRL